MNSIQKIGFVYDEIYLAHDTGVGHYECPERLEHILKLLEDIGMNANLKRIRPRRATLDELQLVHTREYIDIAKRDIEGGSKVLSTGGRNYTHVSPKSFEVARFAVGAGLVGVDEVVSGPLKSVFCAVRPPGHHAEPNEGMGFCVFNNIAIAARYAQKKHGIGKVLIVDWDVHHGNGTQEAFYDDGSVFFMSTHKYLPGVCRITRKGLDDKTGTGEGKGTNMNCSLQPGVGDKEIIEVFEKKLLPAAMEFKPELILISAGFDAREGDPVGRLKVTDNGFKALTRIIKRIADESASGRIVSFLEGGYKLTGVPKGVLAHLQEL